MFSKSLRAFLRYSFFLLILLLSSCQIFSGRKGQPAEVKDSSIDQRINPPNQEKSVIETVPLMNDAVKSLFALAQQNFEQNHFQKALSQLQRAYRIQPNAPEVTQLMAEINLHQGDAQHAYYWATISTQNSPAKGKICEKSWRILALAADILSDEASQAMALENKERCVVKAPNRF